MNTHLYLADNNVVLREIEDNVIDSIVTDPPYGISFMKSKIHWDYNIPSVDTWKECLRVLKPGGHMLVFCGTRTQHRMVTNIEDAGFEIRDVITWLYSSGYPKGLDISKQIDRIELGIVRGERGVVISDNKSMSGSNFERTAKGEPISENAKLWDGWGTCLKPACEFITLVRKPIDEKNIALNVLKWGTGGINIDGSRIELSGEIIPINKLESWSGFGEIDKPDYQKTENNVGRWPANVILDEEAGSILDKQAGHTVSRYFYCAKPNHNEKALGLDSENKHPTQKPVKLLEYLVRLITPKGGVCIDPFMGSGSTGIACVNLDFNFIGIEKEPHYFEIAESRINYVKSQK